MIRMSSAPQKPTPMIERFMPALLIIAVLAVYALCVGAEFISWDDPVNVTANPHLQSPAMESIGWFWSNPYEKLYIPLTYTIWTILAKVSVVGAPGTEGVELNPFVFHAANVICHAIATVLVFHLLRRVARNVWVCAAGAMLFAAHPVQVEAVAWVTALRDVLSGALALGAVWMFLEAAQPVPIDNNASKNRKRLGELQAQPWARWEFYAASTLLFALALLAKPSVVAAVPLVLILHWLSPTHRWRVVIALLVPWLILALIDVLITRNVQTLGPPADGGRWWLRPLIAGDALAFYLYKLVLPIRLGLFYDRTPQAVIEHGWIWFTWIFPVVVFGLVCWFGRKVRWPVAAVLLFIAGVLPVLGLIPFAFQTYSTVADHYLYLSMLGPALALAMGMSAVSSMRIKPAALACGAMFLILCGLTVAQTRYWHDSTSLFYHAYVVNAQSPEATLLLAGQADAVGDWKTALTWYDRAAPYIPKIPSAQGIFHSSKGRTLITAKRYDQAEQELATALQYDPTNQLARYNLDVLRERRAHGTLER
jgi:protein O-mannosyl-transferase